MNNESHRIYEVVWTDYDTCNHIGIVALPVEMNIDDLYTEYCVDHIPTGFITSDPWSFPEWLEENKGGFLLATEVFDLNRG